MPTVIAKEHDMCPNCACCARCSLQLQCVAEMYEMNWSTDEYWYQWPIVHWWTTSLIPNPLYILQLGIRNEHMAVMAVVWLVTLSHMLWFEQTISYWPLQEHDWYCMCILKVIQSSAKWISPRQIPAELSCTDVRMDGSVLNGRKCLPECPIGNLQKKSQIHSHVYMCQRGAGNVETHDSISWHGGMPNDTTLTLNVWVEKHKVLGMLGVLWMIDISSPKVGWWMNLMASIPILECMNVRVCWCGKGFWLDDSSEMGGAFSRKWCDIIMMSLTANRKEESPGNTLHGGIKEVSE